MKKKSREGEARIWRAVADRLSCSRQRGIAVNVSRLNRYTKEGETVVVPGKVLGTGKMDHPIHVAAFAFSEQGRRKILKAKGKCMSILKLTERNPKGTNVKIIG